MPQETKSHAGVGGAGASEGGSLAGFSAVLRDDAMRFDVLEKAFDYRGDVILTLNDGSRVEGYLFDRRRGPTARESTVRLMPASGTGNEKITVGYADVHMIEFSPRDPAAGKSFETWVKKYIEKKMAGEAANIESEKLD
jgi:hypothetical protein